VRPGRPDHNDFKERIADDMEHLVLSCLESRSEGNGSIYGRFLLGPFKVGQGTTVATALRRTLLSELQGIAITAVEIKGVTHQYSSIAGVRESTLDIVLNLKQVVLTGDIRNGLPAIGYLAVQGPKTARARDLKLPDGIRCVDEDQYIASISANGSLVMKFLISAGKNYVSPHSPSAQTLAPSLFQPKMREEGITPLMLRASGQPLHRLVAMVGRNSPVDTKDQQRPLIRGGRPPRLSGRIGDILFSNAGRRVAYAPLLNEVARRLPASAFATYGKVVDANGPSGSSGSKELPTSFWPPGDSQTQTTVDRGSSKPSSLPLLPGNIPKLSPSSLPERQIRPTEGRTPVRPGRLGHRGGAFSVGIQQVSLGGPGNAREAGKAGDGGQFAEIPLNGAQPSNMVSNHRHTLKGLAQRGRQWETDSSPLPIDAVFMPVNKVNFSLQIDDQWQEPRERVILEIWTNGSIHPRQAISEAASYLVYLFSLLRQADAWPAATAQPLLRPRGPSWGSVDQRSRRTQQTVEGQSREGETSNGGSNPHRTTQKYESRRASIGTRRGKSTDIADLDLSTQAYVFLKRAGVNTLGDLLTSSIDNIKGGGIAHASVTLEIDALIKRLALG
jgi:DNA-directed RNA polymerase alpha subunit